MHFPKGVRDNLTCRCEREPTICGQLGTGNNIGQPQIKVVTTSSSTPDVKADTIVRYGSTTLRLGTDYTLSYRNNTKVGTATVTVTGKGSYTGTKSATFKIR